MITAAALRLVPAVAERTVAWAGLADPERALDLLRFLEARTDAIEGFELVPDDSLELVLSTFPAPAPARRAACLACPDRGDAEAAEADRASCSKACSSEALERGLIEDATLAANEAQAEAFWRIRDSISEAERARGGSLAHDISVPVADMPRFMTVTAAEVEAAFPGTKASAFGHLGDGNVHFHVRGRQAGSRAGAAITRMVDDLVTAGRRLDLGGAWHRPDEARRIRAARPARQARAMRAIKHALDPLGLMNPGKLIR